jgi:L-fucose mutarotase/ribose pyranase (RbsD/FucU family)
MLKGISPLISPALLEVLARMGHGDEIILADAHFPGETFNSRVIRADGLRITDLLVAILPLFELDSYVAHPLAMMAAVPGDQLDPAVEASYLAAIRKSIISKYEISGKHLLLNKQQSDDFKNVFGIKGVPHYILFDKKGNLFENGTLPPVA